MRNGPRENPVNFDGGVAAAAAAVAPCRGEEEGRKEFCVLAPFFFCCAVKPPASPPPPPPPFIARRRESPFASLSTLLHALASALTSTTYARLPASPPPPPSLPSPEISISSGGKSNSFRPVRGSPPSPPPHATRVRRRRRQFNLLPSPFSTSSSFRSRQKVLSLRHVYCPSQKAYKFRFCHRRHFVATFVALHC